MSDPTQILPFFFFIIGAILGSFANVLIVRMPAHENIAWPGSHCRNCKTAVRWFDNIPILSYLILRGRCRKCKSRYSPRYLLVEVLMATLFWALYQKNGLQWTLIEYLVFTFGLVTVTFIDFDHMILPDKFTLSGIVLGLVGAAVNPERSFLDAFWGVLFGGGFLYAIAYLYAVLRKQEGMGGGDIKLLGWIGALLGWQAIPFVIIVSSLVGSAVGVILAMRNRSGMQTAIPFGPYLAMSALIYILLGGQAIGEWYLHLHGLN